ncbi:hypothetical protein [Oceanobacillus massiliensis]|nr:hypothetical protein [Oceanobacillus massiliensis]
MQIIYDNDQLNIDNNIGVINEIFNKVNMAIENKNIVFSHLVIDGVDVYENHVAYIEERMDSITKIEIITRNMKEMIWETMDSIHVYLKRAIPALNELVDESYENFSRNSWDGIDQLAEGMQWILQFMTFTKTAHQQPPNWQEIKKSLLQCETSFAQLLEAVEAKDTILITDILSYEVTPAYESLANHLAIALDDKEFLKNVN